MKNYKITLKMAKPFETMVHINKTTGQILIPARVVNSICNCSEHQKEIKEYLNSLFMIDWKCQVIKTVIPGQM